MIYENLLLHNAAEAERRPDGVHLYRYPKALSDSMGLPGKMYGRYVSRTTAGCEIRFVTAGDRAVVSLSSADHDGYVQVYRGDFRYYLDGVYSFPVRAGQVTHLFLNRTPAFEETDASLKHKPGGFSPEVWRVLSDVNFTMTLVDFEGYGYPVRPPTPEEMPPQTMLCYGTSLTYGACASAHSVSYVQLLGNLLGVNILNKAMGGSCMNEAVVADYFASDDLAYDALFLENAINMSDQAEVFHRNTAYLLKRVTQSRPQLPIYLVTCYPNLSTARPGRAYPVEKRTAAEYDRLQIDESMRAFAGQYPQCILLEGADMLPDFTGLTTDLVHLSDYGHVLVATNLAKAIRHTRSTW